MSPQITPLTVLFLNMQQRRIVHSSHNSQFANIRTIPVPPAYQMCNEVQVCSSYIWLFAKIMGRVNNPLLKCT